MYNVILTIFLTAFMFAGNINHSECPEHYKYCPVGIEDYGSFYCKNEDCGVVKDCIYFSDGITENLVLSPSKNNWDNAHVCDPSVVEGKFLFNENEYRYVMAYLGCNNELCKDNRIGLAFSNSLDEPFVKMDNYILKGNPNFWGVGQPSLINLDGKGKILMFYTDGDYITSTKCVKLDLSDVNNLTISDPIPVSNKGTGDFISNGDFIYDGKKLFVCCDTHPFKGNILNFISDVESVYSCEIDINDISQLSCAIWEKEWEVSEKDTGYKKNHNCGFLRNQYGYGNGQEILVTTACEKEIFLKSLFTYDFVRIQNSRNN